MTEPSVENKITCNLTGRNCTRKLETLSRKADDTNSYTSDLLDEFAERQRSLCSETTVRIAVLAELDGAALESPDESQSASDDVEVAISELAASRPIAVVACDSARFLGRCGAYLATE